MWVRRIDNIKMRDQAGIELTILPVGNHAFGPAMRVFGAKMVSSVFTGASGGPLAEAGYLVSHLSSPSSVATPNSDWAMAGTGCGMGSETSGITGATAVSLYGGIHVTGFPISSTTTPAPGSCITARWAKLRIMNGSTAPVLITRVSSMVVFDGNDCPKITTGSGFTTRTVKSTYDLVAVAGNNFVRPASGTLAGITIGSLVVYQSGLPLAGIGKELYVVDVNDTGVPATSHFRVAANPNSTDYLTWPTTFASKEVEVHNLTLIADADRL